MFIVIGLMLAGIVTGFLLRRKNTNWIHPTITGFIWILLFLLGLEVGNNRHIIEGLHTLGLEALLISCAATLGSVLAAWTLSYFLKYKKQASSKDTLENKTQSKTHP